MDWETNKHCEKYVTSFCSVVMKLTACLNTQAYIPPCNLVRAIRQASSNRRVGIRMFGIERSLRLSTPVIDLTKSER